MSISSTHVMIMNLQRETRQWYDVRAAVGAEKLLCTRHGSNAFLGLFLHPRPARPGVLLLLTDSL